MAKKNNEEHSPNYKDIKEFYDHGLWSKARVHKAVVCGWITSEEYEEITGEPYEP